MDSGPEERAPNFNALGELEFEETACPVGEEYLRRTARRASSGSARLSTRRTRTKRSRSCSPTRAPHVTLLEA